MKATTVALSLLAALVAADSYGPLNFKANFGSAPAPFKIEVDPEFIKQTKQKAAWSRLAMENPAVPALADGPTTQNMTVVRDAWAKDYNWTNVQAALNAKYNMFTTTVKPDQSSGYPYDVKLHFVHHRSNRTDAIPLLFMHGWPGSFMEVGHIIDSLTSPPNASLPAFHVVTPSNPGVGFSPAPEHDGLGPVATAHAFHALMCQLGYDKYVVQAGDWGGVMLRAISHAYPNNVVSALSNFWPIKPSDADRAAVANGTASSDLRAYLQNNERYIFNESGYRFIQMNAPLELAASLGDSPVGNAMWIYYLMEIAVTTPNFWSPETIITWSMMYYIQGPYAGVRFYKIARSEGLFSSDMLDFGSPPTLNGIKQPMAISQFPADIWYRMPLELARRGGNNVLRRYVHDRGGHFAATEVPDLVLGDMWTFFGDKELSNTKVFHQ